MYPRCLLGKFSNVQGGSGSLRVKDSGFRVQGSGFWVQDSGFRVSQVLDLLQGQATSQPKLLEALTVTERH
jgi:hypothetical protein